MASTKNARTATKNVPGAKPRGIYAIMRSNREGNYGGSLTVPRYITEVVPEEALFEPVLTEEGILYRFVSNSEPEVAVPTWAKPK